MIDAQKLIHKHSCLQELLRTHHAVFVHVNSRALGVVLPTGLMGLSQVTLQLGLNLPVPIPDLSMDDDGWTATLSFGRMPFWCVIPWGSVYCITGDSGTGGLWPEDCPPEVRINAEAAAGAEDPSSPPAESRNGKLPRGWAIIDGGKQGG